MIPDNRALWELVEKWRAEAMKEDSVVNGYVEPQDLYIWKCADELAAILERPVVVGGWLPIESAPKDGDILAYGLCKPWKESISFLGEYRAGWDPEEEAWITTSHDDTGMPLYIEATHWMPLPTAPETLESMVRGKS